MIRATIACVLIATPMLSHAHTQEAMDACIQAFVAMNLPKEQPIRIKKDSAPASAAFLGRSHRISLTATGATSGKQLARGECIVDRYGAVIALNGKPIPAQLAAAAPKAAETTAAR